MIVYSKKILQFIHEIKGAIKTILSTEIGLKVSGNRFYNHKQAASYPLQVVIYNHKKMLGYFDPNFYELGFHESLMHTSRIQLHQVIKHELAHYITFILHGEGIQPHGPEFRAFCQQMGWGEDIYRATTCLDGGNQEDVEVSGALRKVQKLMALSSSSNKNEAELAMIKSQQLLLKHNMESTYLYEEEEEPFFLKRVLKQKRENGKMRAIARILETFFVTVVFTRANDFTYLEILGNRVNIEIAEYVAGFLDKELDILWQQAKSISHLKGKVAKNSFYLGLAKGYCNKIQALKREYPKEALNALLVIEKKLLDAKTLAYPHLSSVKSHGNYCLTSSALGEQMGRALNIRPGIAQSSNPSGMFISYSE